MLEGNKMKNKMKDELIEAERVGVEVKTEEICEPCSYAGVKVTEGLELIEQEITRGGKSYGIKKIYYCKECRKATGWDD